MWHLYSFVSVIDVTMEFQFYRTWDKEESLIPYQHHTIFHNLQDLTYTAHVEVTNPQLSHMGLRRYKTTSSKSQAV